MALNQRDFRKDKSNAIKVRKIFKAKSTFCERPAIESQTKTMVESEK